MRIRPFQAVYPNLDFIASPDSFFDTVKHDYTEYKQSGFFHKAAQESLYVYQIKSGKKVHTGLITCVDIRDFLDGHIKKHEETLSAKEQQQVGLMLSRGAVVKPVLLTYPSVKSINRLIKKYIADHPVFYDIYFEKKKESHIFWEVSDGAFIQQFQELFERHVPTTYISDGHHRTSTTALMYKRTIGKSNNRSYEVLFSALFPDSELGVYDYNRVVEGLEDTSVAAFIVKLSRLFDIEVLDKPAKPERKHEITMGYGGEWFLLKWKKKVLGAVKKEVKRLDASLLNEKVLNPIFEIEDIRIDQRIKYIEGPKGLKPLQKLVNNSHQIVFCLYPVSLEDMMVIADTGNVLPPKSTWFEPRIKNGLLVLEL